MGVKINRKKPFNFKLSLVYKIDKMFSFIKSERRLRWYLDMAWIFRRMAHEQTFSSGIEVGDQFNNFFFLNGIQPTDKVLDLGCGNGITTASVYSRSQHIVAIDHNEANIQEAQKKLSGSQIKFIFGDVWDYLDNNTDVHFDVIIFSHLLEHIDNAPEFLKRISSRTNRIYIEVPDFECDHLNLYRVAVKSNLNYTDSDHVYEFDRQELSNIITEAGFKISSSEFRFGVMKFWCSKN